MRPGPGYPCGAIGWNAFGTNRKTREGMPQEPAEKPAQMRS